MTSMEFMNEYNVFLQMGDSYKDPSSEANSLLKSFFGISSETGINNKLFMA